MANEGCRLLIRNVELARRIKEPDALWAAAISQLLWASAPQHARSRLDLAEELARQSGAGVSARTHGTTIQIIAGVLLESGQRQRAEELHHQLKEIVERTGQANLLLGWMMMDGVLATLDGRMEDAAAMGPDMLARGEQLGFSQYANVAGLLGSAMAMFHLGRLDEIPRLFKANPLLERPFMRAFTGQRVEAADILEKWVVARPGIGSTDDEVQAFPDVLLLQAALRIEHRPAVELLLRRFSGCILRTTGAYFTTCIQRHLGAAAALLGRPDEARRYYDEALKVCTEMRFRPELALTRLQIAELLLKYYPEEKAAALEHLHFAIKEFREMKMQPSLDRALIIGGRTEAK
jgi:tetratricopeptide (TPR) repeat protein